MLEFFFGEIVFVDEGVDDGEEEVGVYVVGFADGFDGVVAYAEADAEAIDDGYECEVTLYRLAHLHVGVD